MSFQKLILVALTCVLESTSSPVHSSGMPHEAEYLTITPGRTQIKAVGSRLIFTCALAVPENSSGSNLYEVFDMRWKGPDSKYITDTKGRVFTERMDSRRLRLYITEVIDEDAGSYSCEVIVKGAFLTAYSQLELYDDIRFLNGTSAQVQRSLGSDVFLECAAEGKPEPEISWRFRGRKLISDVSSEKYAYEKDGLWIYNITKEDNGTYECRAQVVTQGNLKVRLISLDVLYPPSWITPIENPLVIRGSDVTLDCLADGNPSATYQWFKKEETSNGPLEEPVQVENTAGNGDSPAALRLAGKFQIRSVAMSDQGLYICKASNALGTIKAVYDVKVFVVPVITAPEQLYVLEGRSIVLPCEAAGIPLPSLTWKRKIDNNHFSNDKNISVNASTGGMSRLNIENVDRKRHSGNYTCIASNIAGFDSKDVEVIIQTLPLASISEVELVGWKGERRQVTCFATGLPLPSVAWLHNGNHVGNSHVTKLTTIRDAENVTSILEIDLTEDIGLDHLFGNYSCVAKNTHGYATRAFQLRRAYPPYAPRNVTVTSTTFNSISLSVESAASSEPDSVALPLTEWVLKYQMTSSDAEASKMTINLLYKEGSNIDIGNLDANTAYTMFLSAANAAGAGPSVKFQAKTLPAPVIYGVSDLPIMHPEEGIDFQGDDSRSFERAIAGDSNSFDKDSILEQNILADWGGISLGLFIGIAVMLAILVVTVSGAIVRSHRSMTARRAVMTVVKAKGKPENGGGTTATIKVSECKDIDNLKVETNRPKTAVGPIPGDRFGSLGSKKNLRVTQGTGGSTSTITSSASPVLQRSSAGSGSPELGAPRGGGPGEGISSAQSQAWQNMLVKAEAQARDEALLQQLEAETVTGEFPHPPLEMLLQSGNDLEDLKGQKKEDKEDDEEEEEEEDDDGEVAIDKDGEVFEETMSLNSDDECFQKVPQFEGKSFLQY